MTFLEAAIEILRNEPDGLHFSEIAKRAVDRKLLSHVGRDPEAAMRSCLTSAVRGNPGDGLLARSKPGIYMIRPGAKLPDPPPAPPVVEPPTEEASAAEPEKKRAKSSSRSRTSKATDEGGATKKASKRTSKKKASAVKTTKKKTSRRGKKAEEEKPPEVVETTGEDATSTGDSGEPVPDLAFEAPSGSGLEGVTDVAIVMANAMSRLADERPELREELEAMQSRPEPEVTTIPTRREMRERRSQRESREREPKESQGREESQSEEKGGRRRRRRRRRSRRVDWGEPQLLPAGENQREEILDKVAAVLEEIGSRALHVRQIAETLAAQNFLGGEISEIERAVTAGILMDVRRRGTASRFSIRGDARYQLQNSRVPEPAAKAQKALHEAVRETERKTREQLLAWLQSLGARALEALTRMYLEHEGFSLVGTLPLSRGLGKLIADDPEAEEGESRTLILVVPRKTSLEPRLWDGEAERHTCSATIVISMGEPPEGGVGDARVLYGPTLARWMIENRIGIETVTYTVPVLDATLIESIGGLDT
jgi:hypothetical protein